MGSVFLLIAIMMSAVVIGVQLSRVYPIGVAFPEDPYTGEPLKAFQSLVEYGSVTLDIIGPYKMHQAMIYKNGERYLLVEKFPIMAQVMEGDVLEVWVLEELAGTSLVVREVSENMGLKYSRTSVPLAKGLHRIGKVILK